MFKNYFVFTLLTYVSLSLVSQDLLDSETLNRCKHENCHKEQIEKIVSMIIPEESSIESIEKSAFPGIYKVYYGDLQPLYVSEDGMYFIYGQMFKIDMRVAGVSGDQYGTFKGYEPFIQNLTEKDESEKRALLMKEIKNSELISFEAEKEIYEVTVFTDVDCGYCRKLHNEIDEYNKIGISIRYAAFPRSGLGTDTFNKMVGAWCSQDSKMAISKLKEGKSLDLSFCDSQPVSKHYAIGKKIGITGTPAIVTKSGALLPGYLSPEDLYKKLKS